MAKGDFGGYDRSSSRGVVPDAVMGAYGRFADEFRDQLRSDNDMNVGDIAKKIGAPKTTIGNHLRTGKLTVLEMIWMLKGGINIDFNRCFARALAGDSAPLATSAQPTLDTDGDTSVFEVLFGGETD